MRVVGFNLPVILTAFQVSDTFSQNHKVLNAGSFIPMPINAKWRQLRKAVLWLFFVCCALILLRAGRAYFDISEARFGLSGIAVALIYLLIMFPMFLVLRFPFQLAVLVVFAAIYGWKILSIWQSGSSMNPLGFADYLSPFYGRYYHHDMFWDQIAFLWVIFVFMNELLARLMVGGSKNRTKAP